MPQKLWEANHSIKNKSNLFKFEKHLSKKFSFKASKNYKKLCTPILCSVIFINF